MPPTPASWGDGIVTLGEGRYWPMLVVQLRMIRANNDFPVIVYYRPWAGDVCKEDVRHLDMIEFRPIPAAPGPRRRGGWEAKTLALVDCPFERVLWLDADAYPVAPFATLFDEVSPESPFAYWSDIHTQRFSVNWGMCGMPNHGGDGGVQGGHLLLHRPAAWRLLACANWLNQHSEYFYRAGFGDQDMWRIAIKLLGTPHHVLGQTEYHGEGTVVKHGEAPVVVHRINCKMWGETGDVRNDALPCESEAWGFRLPSKPAASPVASLPAPLGVVAAAARPASRLGECWYLPAQKAVLAKVCGLALDNDLAADLGCWTGTSTLVLADRFRAVLAIDRWRQVPGGPADYDEAEDAYGLFRERLSRFKNVMCLRMDHEDAIRLLDGPLDLVHLDGDHNYGPVLAQINWAKRVVRAGGVICGHDLDNPNTPGVRRAVEAALGTDWQHSEWVWWHVVKAAPDAGPKGGAR
jgi:SAM-dependent methyltransferase